MTKDSKAVIRYIEKFKTTHNHPDYDVFEEKNTKKLFMRAETGCVFKIIKLNST